MYRFELGTLYGAELGPADRSHTYAGPYCARTERHFWARGAQSLIKNSGDKFVDQIEAIGSATVAAECFAIGQANDVNEIFRHMIAGWQVDTIASNACVGLAGIEKALCRLSIIECR